LALVARGDWGTPPELTHLAVVAGLTWVLLGTKRSGNSYPKGILEKSK